MNAIRTFVAVLIEEELKCRLSKLQAEIKSCAAGIKWVAPENLHVTLKFLGGVERSRVSDVFSAVENAAVQIQPFRLSLGGVGAFPGLSRPRVVWVGVDAGRDEIARLAAAVESCLADVGFTREEKPFRAHVTIGRLRDGARPPDLAKCLPKEQGSLGEQQVRCVAVVASDLTPAGPVYTVMKTFELGAGAAQSDASQ